MFKKCWRWVWLLNFDFSFLSTICMDDGCIFGLLFVCFFQPKICAAMITCKNIVAKILILQSFLVYSFDTTPDPKKMNLQLLYFQRHCMSLHIYPLVLMSFQPDFQNNINLLSCDLHLRAFFFLLLDKFTELWSPSKRLLFLVVLLLGGITEFKTVEQSACKLLQKSKNKQARWYWAIDKGTVAERWYQNSFA